MKQTVTVVTPEVRRKVFVFLLVLKSITADNSYMWGDNSSESTTQYLKRYYRDIMSSETSSRMSENI